MAAVSTTNTLELVVELRREMEQATINDAGELEGYITIK